MSDESTLTRAYISAIDVAHATGRRLIIAGIIQDQAYFDELIEPRLDDTVEFIGPVGPEQRDTLFGGALASLHLTTIPERFGLTMAESMATGTPVIGIDLGSVAEVVANGETGYVVATTEDAIEAVAKSGRHLQIGVPRPRRALVFSRCDGRRVSRRISHDSRRGAGYHVPALRAAHRDQDFGAGRVAARRELAGHSDLRGRAYEAECKSTILSQRPGETSLPGACLQAKLHPPTGGPAGGQQCDLVCHDRHRIDTKPKCQWMRHWRRLSPSRSVSESATGPPLSRESVLPWSSSRFPGARSRSRSAWASPE